MIAHDLTVKRKARIKGATLCLYCDAEYINNGGWGKGFDIAKGTESPRYMNVRRLPADVCPVCERPSTPPTENTEE